MDGGGEALRLHSVHQELGAATARRVHGLEHLLLRILRQR